MSRDYDSDNGDYPTAVAAAAYAVRSLEESNARDQNAKIYSPHKSLNKMNSLGQLKDETSKESLKDPDVSMPTSTLISKEMPEKAKDPSPAFKNKISFSNTDENTTKTCNPSFEKASKDSPSMGTPSNFADKHLNTNGSKSLETPIPKPGPGDSMADAWEKEEMASIKERYERLRTTIDNWEIKRKKKANRKLERREANPHNNTSKAVRSHGNGIKGIEEIAGEARTRADAKRRKDELKVKEKANKIRLTGKLPATCLCF